MDENKLNEKDLENNVDNIDNGSIEEPISTQSSSETDSSAVRKKNVEEHV